MLAVWEFSSVAWGAVSRKRGRTRIVITTYPSAASGETPLREKEAAAFPGRKNQLPGTRFWGLSGTASGKPGKRRIPGIKYPKAVLPILNLTRQPTGLPRFRECCTGWGPFSGSWEIVFPWRGKSRAGQVRLADHMGRRRRRGHCLYSALPVILSRPSRWSPQAMRTTVLALVVLLLSASLFRPRDRNSARP